MRALLTPELLCVSAGIRVHNIYVDIITYSFHILEYHTIYTHWKMMWYCYAYYIKNLENLIYQYQAGITKWWYQAYTGPNSERAISITSNVSINNFMMYLAAKVSIIHKQVWQNLATTEMCWNSNNLNIPPVLLAE
jgi:hypothetical protein